MRRDLHSLFYKSMEPEERSQISKRGGAREKEQMVKESLSRGVVVRNGKLQRPERSTCGRSVKKSKVKKKRKSDNLESRRRESCLKFCALN